MAGDKFVDSEVLHIKNMVCPRCIKDVKQIFKNLNIKVDAIYLGEIILSEPLSGEQKEKLSRALYDEGFELLDDRRTVLINQIKTILLEVVQYDAPMPKSKNVSDFLSQKLGHDYSYMSNLFTNIEGCSIEKYLIRLRMERVKELLVYDELSLSEIADKLNYSSVAHLSAQFKKEIGVSPTAFKKLSRHDRKPLDNIS